MQEIDLRMFGIHSHAPVYERHQVAGKSKFRLRAISDSNSNRPDSPTDAREARIEPPSAPVGHSLLCSDLPVVARASTASWPEPLAAGGETISLRSQRLSFGTDRYPEPDFVPFVPLCSYSRFSPVNISLP